MNAEPRRLRGWWPILVLALGLRLAGIASESLWVDEAFSADASRGALVEILETNARDTHPPAYYIGLSLWRALFSAAESDPSALAVVLRGYSVVWSLLGILLLMELTRALAGDATARIAGVFAAVNPLEIYFAGEARMYTQATALSLAGALALWRWTSCLQKRKRWWPWAVAFSLCGVALLFTHYVGITLLVGQGLVALLVFVRRRAWASVLGLALAALGVGLLFWPWLDYVLSFRDSLVRGVGLDWMPTPGFWDYVSPIGREFFWGRVHKIHSQWWIPTALLPLSILGLAFWRWEPEGERDGRSVAAALFLLGCGVFPLLLCGAVGFGDQVIYYRPRYSVFVLPYFVIGLAIACRSLGSVRATALAAASVVGLMLVGTGLQHWTPQKRAWRETAEAWPRADAPAFYVVLPAQHQRPLGHYLGGRIRHTPRPVLERLGPLPEGALIWVASWPEPLDPEDAAYRDWLKSVGPARRQALDTHYTLTQVEPRGDARWPDFARERFRAWYRPFDIRGQIAGFSDAVHFGPLFFDEAGDAVRRSEGWGLLRFDDVRGGETLVLRATASTDGARPILRALRGAHPGALATEGRVVSFDASAGEYRVTVPPGEAPLWVGWSDSQAARHGLTVHWVGIAKDTTSGVAFRD